MPKALHLITGAATLALGLNSAWASVVISIPSPAYTTQNSIGAGQAIGNDGYTLFEASPVTADAVNPSYVSGGVSLGTSPTVLIAGNYIAITLWPTPISHTSTNSEVAYLGDSDDGDTLATFTLTGTVPQEFQIGLLDDTDSGGNANTTDYTVYDYNPSTRVTTEMSPTKTSDIYNSSETPGVNDFYFVDISGASAGDKISITGYNDAVSPDHIALGGVTFDTLVAAPEPTALGLLAIGAVGMLARPRGTRRRPSV